MQLNNIDMDMEKRRMILRAFQSGVPHTQAKENIEKRFGDCVGFGVRTCERWYRKFKHADFDLTTKPRDKLKKDYSYSTRRKTKKSSSKTVKKVNEIKFYNQQQNLPLPKLPLASAKAAAETAIAAATKASAMNDQTNANVQKLMRSKRELTIKKIPANSGAASGRKGPLESTNNNNNSITSTPTLRPMPHLTPVKSSTEITNAIPSEMPKLRPRRPRSKGIEINIPVNSAKRMSAQTLTESHSIGEGRKLPTRTSETSRSTANRFKEVTVQFQNLNPDVAKNTVRKNTTKSPASKRQSSIYLKSQTQNTSPMLKITNVAHIESMSPEKNKSSSEQATTPTSKRDSLTHPQTSPLNNQKGIIYLNPQEIFPKSFGGFESSLKRPSPYSRPAQQTTTQHITSPTVQQQRVSLPPPAAAVEIQDSPIHFDSDDSGEDVLFPENINLPAPKTKADSTYITYFDMESCQPIQLNPEEPVLTQPAIPVIEID
ncbi:uncharacterized protein LOC129947412 [Eupeodes corollae]|uniref:uncharacterized protein LOC129947412 n=1 Tax=Eupeodes corollae TaxID=290404 RepID=UPI00249144A9|nr:uncharacterized protein LOC129947412 [Eupeodes corollae]